MTKRIGILLGLLALSGGLAFATSVSKGNRLRQLQEFPGAVAGSSAVARIWYVDSADGSNGSLGISPTSPLATLAYALTQAESDDTIFLTPGGSETVTSTISVSTARVKIFCPADNLNSGYTITGAGTLDLMTVSAANVTIEGLRFVHTGTTSSTSGILTTAAADQLTVSSCLFSDVAATSSAGGAGVELVDDADYALIEGCTFIDTVSGVLCTTANAATCVSPTVRDCVFYCGMTTGFGIRAEPTGSGAVLGFTIRDCVFLEQDGGGTAATDAWNGTDGTDGASGPILFAVGVDQWVTVNCRAQSIGGTPTFANSTGIPAGAVGVNVNSAP